MRVSVVDATVDEVAGPVMITIKCMHVWYKIYRDIKEYFPNVPEVEFLAVLMNLLRVWCCVQSVTARSAAVSLTDGGYI